MITSAKPSLMAGLLVFVTFQGLAATDTPENRKSADFLASAAETESNLSVLSSDGLLDKTIGELLKQITPRLLSFSGNTKDEILRKMSDREIRLLDAFFHAKEGAAFIRKQELIAADIAPILGREVFRTVTGGLHDTGNVPSAAAIPADRARDVDSLRPLIHSLFEDSFQDYKKSLLSVVPTEERETFEKAARRFDLSVIEKAYCDALKRRLTDQEARQAALFFSDFDSAYAYKKYANCRRAAICGMFTEK